MGKQSLIPRILLLLALAAMAAQKDLPTQAASDLASGVRGTVIDAVDARVAGAVVLIESKTQSWKVRSDEVGEFNVVLPAGTYRFRIEGNGFKSLMETVTVKEGSTTTHTFSLVGEWGDRGDGYAPTIDEALIETPNLVVNSMSLRMLPQSAPNIGVNGYAATDKVQRGHVVQVAVVMDIPSGYHVNSNRPLESFLKATQLKLEAPGVRVGAVAYPRAVLRKFAFSNDKLSVYEGRVILRFSVTMPASFKAGSLELKAKLNYQSCSDSLCFPPQSRDVRLEIPVVGATDSVKRINGEYFGRGR